MQKFTLIVLAIFLLTSCSEDEAIQPISISKWKLIEVYIDPGDGSGEYLEFPYLFTLEFFSDFTVISNVCFNRMHEPEIGPFNVVHSFDDEYITPSEECSQSLKMKYGVNEEFLYVIPFCFEGCGYKFALTN